MTDSQTPIPNFNFISHPSTQPFTLPLDTFLSSARQIDAKFAYVRFIATGALIFNTSPSPSYKRHILLIKRAAHDSMPNRWETPGGGVDAEDASILHGVARETWEEAGLTATGIGPVIGEPHFFTSRSGKGVCKFNFIVEAAGGNGGLEMNVKLDPAEHQAFVWATEDEVRAGRVVEVEVVFTTAEQRAIVLEGFRVRGEMGAETVS